MTTINVEKRRACDVKPGDVIKLYNFPYGGRWYEVVDAAPLDDDVEVQIAYRVKCKPPTKPHWWSRQQPTPAPPCTARSAVDKYATIEVQTVTV